MTRKGTLQVLKNNFTFVLLPRELLKKVSRLKSKMARKVAVFIRAEYSSFNFSHLRTIEGSLINCRRYFDATSFVRSNQV
jgi:hypothetical protein